MPLVKRYTLVEYSVSLLYHIALTDICERFITYHEVRIREHLTAGALKIYNSLLTASYHFFHL